MKKPAIIIVVFDQITRSEFFKRLSWDYMVDAWSNTIRWEQINPTTIKLDLAGIDGMDSIFITRRHRGNKIFIGARNSERELIQTGVWEYEDDAELAVCYRRVHKRELANLLQDRLADFCCSTFLRKV
ncbi:hypothetical protein [Vibrio splendidus]|uniref:hypothetical protein n=1 Tax=Vibrio splendidus TaxID=29497 RepID=UPI000C864DE5|nr:hypothetical protein [Vibrio splendidus]PMP42486.1 hypothetical protein BCS86_14110 [Vibrio splendidus]